MGGEALQRLSNGLIFAAKHKGGKMSEGTFTLKKAKSLCNDWDIFLHI
jgi:hypothetical protein